MQLKTHAGWTCKDIPRYTSVSASKRSFHSVDVGSYKQEEKVETNKQKRKKREGERERKERTEKKGKRRKRENGGGEKN